MRLLKVMQRQDNYLQHESYNQSRTGGLPVPRQEAGYNSEPTSTTSVLQRNQPQSQSYSGQQTQIKVERSVDQTPCSYSNSMYKDTRHGYPNEAQEMRSCPQETVTQSHQPRPQAMFENRSSATSSQLVQPSQPVISSTQNTQNNLQTTNIFYENTVNKDSEIKLSMEDRQNLMSDNRNNATTSSVDLVIEEVVSSQEPINTELNLSSVSPSDDDDLSQRPMSSDKTHVCMTCFKSFKNKPQLTQHELVHNNMRKHVCSYCEKSFKQLCHLNQHIRTHTGERPYKCVVEGCGRAFAQLSNLHHHQKNHEEHVKRHISRQFRCVICDRSYANESSLRTHTLKLHENLKSPEDGSSLYMSPPTKKRKKKQSGEAPHLAVLTMSSDQEGLPTQVTAESSAQVKEEFSLTKPSNQISQSSSNQISPSSSNQISSSSSNQISPSYINQSAISQVRNLLATSPNAAINQILQKRLLTDPNVPEILRSHQHLLPSFPSAESQRSRQDETIVTPFQPLPKVSELACSLPQNRVTFNPDLPSQSHLQ